MIKFILTATLILYLLIFNELDWSCIATHISCEVDLKEYLIFGLKKTFQPTGPDIISEQCSPSSYVIHKQFLYKNTILPSAVKSNLSGLTRKTNFYLTDHPLWQGR